MKQKKNSNSGAIVDMRERGSALIEYSLLVSLIALMGYAFLPAFSTKVQCRMVTAINGFSGGGSETNTSEGENCEMIISQAFHQGDLSGLPDD